MAFYFDNRSETPDPALFRDATNGTGGDYAAGIFLTGYYDAATVPAAASDPVLCLTREIIKAGSHGRVTSMKGQHPVLAGTGGFSKGQRLTVEANTGKAIPWAPSTAANASVVGIAQQDAAANTLGQVELGVGAVGQG